MKEKLEEKMLHTIVVPAKQFIWIKYKKEIRVGDKMFDIKSMRVEHENYIFTGLYDEEEATLNNSLKNLTDQKNERGNQLLSSLFHLIQSVFIEDEANPQVVDILICEYSPLILQHISSPCKNILTPPPQQLSTYS